MAATHRLRILHLSDLHARVAMPWMKPERRRLVRQQKPLRERVLGDALFRAIDEIAAEAPVDLVCFTGDVADWGLEEEYEQAGALFERLLDQLRLESSRLFVVPGNHDVDRRVATDDWQALRKLLAEREDVAERLGGWANQTGAPSGVDPALVERVVGRQAGFWAWVRDRLGRGELVPGASEENHATLGYRVSLSLPSLPLPVQVIGLNSGWLCGDDNDAGKIAITREQVYWLAHDGAGHTLPGFRLALVHHPVAELATRDASEVRKVLCKPAVDLLLHGHQHETRLETVIDPSSSIDVVASGSLYEGDKGDRYFNGFHVIDVEFEAGAPAPVYTLTFYGWSPNGHWFRNDGIYRRSRHGRLVWGASDRAQPGQASPPATVPPAHPTGLQPAAAATAAASAPPAQATGTGESLRRSWHPPHDFDNRGPLEPVGFRINGNFRGDGEHRWERWCDVLVSLEQPSNSDEVYLLPSRKAPRRFHDPRMLKRGVHRDAKRTLIARFVAAVGFQRVVEGLSFVKTMRDGAKRTHVYAAELDSYLTANAGFEARSVVYVSFKRIDEPWRARLREVLGRDKRLSLWDETDLRPGEDYAKRMGQMIGRARVLIVLASPEYLASPMPVSLELDPAIGAAQAEELTLLWAPVRSFDFVNSKLGPFVAPVAPDRALEGMPESEWRAALERVYRATCAILGLEPLAMERPNLTTLIRRNELG